MQQNGRTQTLSSEHKASRLTWLRQKIEAREALVGVVGLGYVGLPLALEYARIGFHTVGVDISTQRVEKLNAGVNYIQDVDDAELGDIVASEQFRASTDFGVLRAADIVFICVPTPVTPNKDPDTSYIREAALSVAAYLHAGQLIILRSTTYPDTTEGLVQPIFEDAAREEGLVLGRDYFLAFSPERIDPGNSKFTTANTPVVVGGVTQACTELSELAMQQIVDQVHPVSSPKVAEMEKLLENIFRSVNIALVNELAKLCDRIGGISIWEVIEAASTKPFGYMPFYPGPGLGGHCIPIDPYYLSWLARRYDFETNFITLSARINEEMPFYVGEAVLRAVAEQPVRLREAKVLLLGVAFKPDVDDTRNSPAYKVVEILRAKRVEHIAFSDPHVPSFDVATEAGVLHLESIALTEAALREHHVVIILANHRAFPYAMIAEQAHAIIDTRNAMAHIPHDREKVWLLGGGRI